MSSRMALQIVVGAFFFGGTGRPLSIYTVGLPANRALIVLGIELLAPVICMPWHARRHRTWLPELIGK